MPGILPSPSLTSLELLLAKTTTNNEGGKGRAGVEEKKWHTKKSMGKTKVVNFGNIVLQIVIITNSRKKGWNSRKKRGSGGGKVWDWCFLEMVVCWYILMLNMILTQKIYSRFFEQKNGVQSSLKLYEFSNLQSKTSEDWKSHKSEYFLFTDPAFFGPKSSTC